MRARPFIRQHTGCTWKLASNERFLPALGRYSFTFSFTRSRSVLLRGELCVFCLLDVNLEANLKVKNFSESAAKAKAQVFEHDMGQNSRGP